MSSQITVKALSLALGTFAASEMCRGDGDCNHEMCTGDGWAVNCHRGTCTCDHADQTGTKCTSADMCTGRCPDNHRQHCVDGMCRCLRN